MAGGELQESGILAGDLDLQWIWRLWKIGLDETQLDIEYLRFDCLLNCNFCDSRIYEKSKSIWIEISTNSVEFGSGNIFH